MSRILKAGFLNLLLVSPILLVAQSDRFAHLLTTPLNYVAYRSNGQIEIDGKMNERSWREAPWSSTFVDIEGTARTPPAHTTRFKMLWDNDHLYIAAELTEPHIWATLKNRDAIIYHDNDFEIFIDPDGDSHNYYEIEVNAFNTVFDLFLPKPYRNGGRPDLKWNVTGLRTAIEIDGTINNPKDTDKKWTIEFAIPFRSLSLSNDGSIPTENETWRINFSRVQWNTIIDADGYTKKMDNAGSKPVPEMNWVWSPQGVINMHYPERWGYVQFSDKKVGRGSHIFIAPSSEKFKEVLWKVYYLQREYFQQHRVFAPELSVIGMSNLIKLNDGERAELNITVTGRSYEASIKSSSGTQHWQLTSEGKIMNLNSSNE